MSFVNGYIKNSTGGAVPYATVAVYDADFKATGEATAANSSGYFYLNINDYNDPYALSVSSVGFKPVSVKLPGFVNGSVITMQTNYVEGDPVVVYSDQKKFPAWLALLPLAAIAMDQNKKKISGINQSNVKTGLLLGGGLIVLFAGNNILNKLLELFGIRKTQDEKDIDNIFTAPDDANPWSPNFWKTGPVPGTRILTDASATEYAKRVKNSLGLLDDDEDGLYALFRAMPTQSCVSFLAQKFFQLYYKDMLSYLRGGYPPADGLNDSELNKVNQIILSKPKYW